MNDIREPFVAVGGITRGFTPGMEMPNVGLGEPSVGCHLL